MNVRLVYISMVSACLLAFAYPKQRPEIPGYFPEPKHSSEQYSDMQIELGRMLFYDPILSRDSTISCSSCHSSYNAFAHTDHRLSHGIEDRIGTRNAPPLFNLEWQEKLMWDGAANHPEVQPVAPISNALEMDENLEHVVQKLSRQDIYKNMFATAFGHEEVTGQRVLKAIAAFQLSLRSFGSKYDLVKSGEATFTAQENSGYSVFLKHCNTCHREPLFSTFEFANNGLPVDADLKDAGRMRITLEKSDSLLFKIPSLRNLKYTPPYMHDGRFRKMSEVLDHYKSGIVKSETLAKELESGITLSDVERTDLMAFLSTLNDSSFVFNPALQYPKAHFVNP